MIARITRILLLLQIAIVIGLFATAFRIWHVGNIWLAMILAVAPVLLLRALITANNFFIAWIYRSETPSTFHLNWRQACRLFKDEFQATMLTSSWTMPFHAFTKRLVTNSKALPVLLIHGYGCNSGYWQGMSRVLMREHVTHYAIDMEPVLSTIDVYASLMHDAIETLCNETGQTKIIVVAHSMGGLAARAYLRKYGSDRIARVITLGTPHHGTCHANFSIGINGQQMRWLDASDDRLSSNWLHHLAESEDDDIRALFVSIYSHHDNIISPQTSSYLPGAKNIEVHGIGHVALALDPTVQAKVVEEIYLASQPQSNTATRKSA